MFLGFSLVVQAQWNESTIYTWQLHMTSHASWDERDVGGSKIRWYKELHSGWKTTQNCLILVRSKQSAEMCKQTAVNENIWLLASLAMKWDFFRAIFRHCASGSPSSGETRRLYHIITRETLGGKRIGNQRSWAPWRRKTGDNNVIGLLVHHQKSNTKFSMKQGYS